MSSCLASHLLQEHPRLPQGHNFPFIVRTALPAPTWSESCSGSLLQRRRGPVCCPAHPTWAVIWGAGGAVVADELLSVCRRSCGRQRFLTANCRKEKLRLLKPFFHGVTTSVLRSASVPCDKTCSLCSREPKGKLCCYFTVRNIPVTLRLSYFLNPVRCGVMFCDFRALSSSLSGPHRRSRRPQSVRVPV